MFSDRRFFAVKPLIEMACCSLKNLAAYTVLMWAALGSKLVSDTISFPPKTK
jgi:hypothetical protein